MATTTFCCKGKEKILPVDSGPESCCFLTLLHLDSARQYAYIILYVKESGRADMKQTVVRIDPEMKRELKILAARTNRTVQSIVREILQKGLIEKSA